MTAQYSPLRRRPSHRIASLIGVHFVARRDPTAFTVRPLLRGRLKQALIKTGYPMLDLAGYTIGEPRSVALRETSQRRPLHSPAVSARSGQHLGCGISQCAPRRIQTTSFTRGRLLSSSFHAYSKADTIPVQSASSCAMAEHDARFA